MISDTNILKHIARQPKRAAGYKQLVRELGLHGEARGELESRLQKLVEAHELVQLNSDRYALPQPAADKNDKNLVAGRLIGLDEDDAFPAVDLVRTGRLRANQRCGDHRE